VDQLQVLVANRKWAALQWMWILTIYTRCSLLVHVIILTRADLAAISCQSACLCQVSDHNIHWRHVLGCTVHLREWLIRVLKRGRSDLLRFFFNKSFCSDWCNTRSRCRNAKFYAGHLCQVLDNYDNTWNKFHKQHNMWVGWFLFKSSLDWRASSKRTLWSCYFARSRFLGDLIYM